MTKNNSTKDIVKFLWNQKKASPKLIYLMIFSQVVMTIMTATIAPIYISRLLTHIADGTASMRNDIGLLIIYAVVLFVSNILVMRLTILLAYVTETKMQSITAQKILANLTARSLSYHANRMSGGIVSDSNRLSGSIERFWDMVTFNITPIITTIVSTCLVLGLILWQFSIALVVLSIIIIFLIIKVQTSRTEFSKEVAERGSAMTAHLADVLGNIAVVKAFAQETSELNKYTELNDLWRKANMKEMKYNLTTGMSFGLMMSLMNVIAFAAAIIATESNIANIGTIYLAISYTLNIVSQLWSTSHVTRTFLRIIGDASPMIKTLGEAIEINDTESPNKLSVKQGSISFKNITFKHEKNKKPLFNKFSLDIAAGERVGLVGKSGAGKTSLTRLLLRFSDIDSGKIMIDSQDITRVSQKNLRNVIAFVPQEPTLFHRSLRDNIAYGKPEATNDEVWEAVKKANAIDFIKELPDGMETTVGERGVKLSGGQRQRIAIARAILKDAPILILDEATSALDSENEKLIQDALSQLMKNRTSIVIAHRLSTIAKLDRIIVIDDGEIIEQGTHQELLKNKGIYAKLWQHQSGGFIEE